MQPELPPPSAVMAWLQEAEAAQRRCKALLPKQWVNLLDHKKAMAAAAKASLQHMQQRGDRWRQLTPAEEREMDAAGKEAYEAWKDPASSTRKLTCSGCGNWAPQLRVCSACREAQYCR